MTKRPLHVVACIALLVCSADARADLLVSDNFGNQVLRFDATTGAFQDVLVEPNAGGLTGAVGMVVGPDNLLWVASQGTNAILRFDQDTGDFIDVFASNDETGGAAMSGPSDIGFTLDGSKLLVSNLQGGTVDAFDVTTGRALGPFTTGAPIAGASNFTFGPDDELYVSSFGSNEVLRFDGTTGAFIDSFASGGGLNGPAGLAFAGDDLLVSSLFGQQILKFDATTGDFVDVFASPPAIPAEPDDLPPFPGVILARASGDLLVSLTGQGSVVSYDLATGLQNPFAAFGGGLLVPGEILELMDDLLAGDANGDGVVDLVDFNLLKENFGAVDATRAQGDFNQDAIVDLVDFNILKENFGAGASVPEPGAASLVAGCGVAMLVMLRRRRRVA